MIKKERSYIVPQETREHESLEDPTSVISPWMNERRVIIAFAHDLHKMTRHWLDKHLAKVLP